MSELNEGLNFLSWPTETVNAVRGLLADLNVPLPAVLAQLLALLVLVGLAVVFVSRARAAQESMTRLIQWIVVGAASVASIAIVAAWIDCLLNPRSEQIVGRIVAPPHGADFRVDLLDYRGESLAPALEKDETGAFAVTYAPEFADPPSALLASAGDCKESRIRLRRAHLLGADLSIALDCSGNHE